MMNTQQEQARAAWLASHGYESVDEWAEDEGYWIDRTDTGPGGWLAPGGWPDGAELIDDIDAVLDAAMLEDQPPPKYLPVVPFTGDDEGW